MENKGLNYLLGTVFSVHEGIELALSGDRAY